MGQYLILLIQEVRTVVGNCGIELSQTIPPRIQVPRLTGKTR